MISKCGRTSRGKHGLVSFSSHPFQTERNASSVLQRSLLQNGCVIGSFQNVHSKNVVQILKFMNQPIWFWSIKLFLKDLKKSHFIVFYSGEKHQSVGCHAMSKSLGYFLTFLGLRWFYGTHFKKIIGMTCSATQVSAWSSCLYSWLLINNFLSGQNMFRKQLNLKNLYTG